MRLLEDVWVRVSRHTDQTVIIWWKLVWFVPTSSSFLSFQRLISFLHSLLYTIMDAMPPLVALVTLMHSLKWALIRSCQSLSILLVAHKLYHLLVPVCHFVSTSRGAGCARRWTVMSTYTLWQARPVKAAMLENLYLIPLTKHPARPSLSAAHTLCRGSYANFPRPCMTIRSVSLHAHKCPCDYSTLCSTPEAFGDCHLTQSHTATMRSPNKEGQPSLFTPLTSRTHAGRLGCEDLDARLLDDLWGKKKKQPTIARSF